MGMGRVDVVARAIVLAAATVVAGCGDGTDPTATMEPTTVSAPVTVCTTACDEPVGSSDGVPQPPEPTVKVNPDDGNKVTAVLNIAVRPDAKAAAKVARVTCPARSVECAWLATHRDVLDAAPRDQMCTEIYGGPETATVTGTVDGRQVKAKFSRTDGCQISRWEAASPLWGAAA